jgi:uncharacterized protein DUF5667
MNRIHQEFELAEALEQALAERGATPAMLGCDVVDLLQVARMLEDTATAIAPSDEFRARSRQRLLTHMARSARRRSVPSSHSTLVGHIRQWAVRLVASMVALGATGFAAAGASASALPGDPLYPVKQVTEAAALQLAPTDSTRQDVLLQQADTRLDETARLLDQGRDSDAAVTVARYGQTLAALASAETVQSQLNASETRLKQLLESAPPQARAGLERALASTERGADRGRSTSPATASYETAAPPTPEPPRRQRQPQDANPEPTATRPSDPADAGERGRATIHGGTAASHRDDLPDRAQPPRNGVEPDAPAANESTLEPDGAPVADDRSPRVDAHIPPANSHTNTPQKAGPGPQRGGATRPPPAPRGRP